MRGGRVASWPTEGPGATGNELCARWPPAWVNCWTPPWHFASDCVGPDAERAVQSPPPSRVVLLENLRFHPGEEQNDPAFAKALARLADVYVNDAFGAAHRAHASVEALVRLMPNAAAGLLMERELRYLGDVHALAIRPARSSRSSVAQRCRTRSRSSIT